MLKIKKLKVKKKTEEKGITLVTLAITIIVLLILAGITINGIFGDSGIIQNAKKAKEESEIGEEKEIINISVIAVLGNNTNYGITQENLQKHLNEYVGTEKAKVVKDDKNIYVKFVESERYFKVEEDGNIDGPVNVEIAKDANPGDITTDSEGKTLAGTEEEPYEISCIEDLCGFSNSVNSGTSYSGKYIVLTRDLDFNSDFSYVDGSISVSGNIENCNNIEELMNVLTDRKNTGFVPISNFKGNFNGQNYAIKNIYENTDKTAGLFGNIISNATIKNLTITGEIISNKDAGGLIGSASGVNIENIYNYVNVLSTNKCSGGIIGKGGATINKCINYGTIKNTSTKISDESAGGIIGYRTSGDIINCANYGEVFGKDAYTYDGTGGIAGAFHGSGKVYNTCNYADISGGMQAGGIIGSYVGASLFNLTNVCNIGKITYTSYKQPGGFVGCTRDTPVDSSTVLNSYYNSSTAMGVGNWPIQVGTQYTEEQLKSEAFVNTLNAYIQSNTDGIDTTGWAKWVYNEGDYPILDISTTWNGTEWEQK